MYAALTLLALVSPAYAFVIDFEGIAPAGGITSAHSVTVTVGGFVVHIDGHIVDSNAPDVLSGFFANNGTDWALEEFEFELTRSDGGPFSLLSLDVSEFANTPFIGLGNTLTLTGHLQGGGTIVANFVTDNTFGFETIAPGSDWTNLVQLDLASNFDSLDRFMVLGYDNINVVSLSVPEPTSQVLLLTGLAGLSVSRWATKRRRTKAYRQGKGHADD
jgi:hypothetical protein